MEECSMSGWMGTFIEGLLTCVRPMGWIPKYSGVCMAETDKDDFDLLLAEIEGSKTPFFFSDLDGENHCVRLMQNNIFPTQNEHEVYSNNLSLIEESYA